MDYHQQEQQKVYFNCNNVDIKYYNPSNIKYNNDNNFENKRINNVFKNNHLINRKY